MTSSLQQKAIASAINIALILLAGSPLYWVLSVDEWRLATIGMMYSYCWIFRRRCIGMMVAGTCTEKPMTFIGVTAYTASFSTLLWWVVIPFDVAIINGLLQLRFIRTTGNTIHGTIGGYATYHRG